MRTTQRRLEAPSRSLVVVMLAVAGMAAGCEYFRKEKAHDPPASTPPAVQVMEARPQAVKIYSEWVS